MNYHLQGELPWPPATAQCTPWLTGSKCDPGLLPGQCTSQVLCQEGELGLHFCLGMAAETTSAAWFLLSPHLGAVYHWRILWDCASKGVSGKSKKLKHFCKPIKLKKSRFLNQKTPSEGLQGVLWKEIIWLAKETEKNKQTCTNCENMKQRALSCVLLEQEGLGTILLAVVGVRTGSGKWGQTHKFHWSSSFISTWMAGSFLSAQLLSLLCLLCINSLSLSLNTSHSISAIWILQDKAGILCKEHFCHSAGCSAAQVPLLLLSHSRLLPAEGKNFTFCNVLMAK